MEALWFCILVFMLTMYAMLDGFDLGAGLIHLFFARADHERRSILPADGPLWDSNDVWLLLAGGALYCAFSSASSSPGFYPLALALLSLLILRGIGVALRRRVDSPSWDRVFDISYGISSLLLAVALGAAVGCVIRGVPPTSESRILYGFPALCGICALATLTLQSAAGIALKASGELQIRCRILAARVWWVALLCYAAVIAAIFGIKPQLLDNLQTSSPIAVFAVIALAGLLGTRLCLSVGFDLGAFSSASCLVAGLLACVAAGEHLQLRLSALWLIPAFLLIIGRALRTTAHPQPMHT